MAYWKRVDVQAERLHAGRGQTAMDRYQSLYELAKLLLSQDDSQKTAEILLQRLLRSTGAERGFIVVREGESFERRFDVGFEPAQTSEPERRFSRSLVQRAIETGQILDSPSPEPEARQARSEGPERSGPSCVLAVPLRHAGEVFGVAYLERRGRIESLSEEARRFAAEFAELAGLFLKRDLEREALRGRSQSLERDLLARFDFEGIVTRDPGMLQLLKSVSQVADSDAPALVLGETGTGKELIARALHLNSSRKSKPFVTLHCTAVPAAILESELFGHAKVSSSTGAERERAGRIASAAGGTLLLDEIAEIAPEAQAKVSRLLKSGEFQRVGSHRTEKADVRIVAATHQDLEPLVQAGRFRQDLYLALKVIELRVPPLRERLGDLPLLVEHFLRKYWKRSNPLPRLSRHMKQALASHRFPGNVRELEHLIERACLLSDGPKLEVDLPPAEPAPAAPSGSWGFERYDNEELKIAREAALAEVERQFLCGLLERWDGNVSRAAREAGIHRTYLQRLIAEHRPLRAESGPLDTASRPEVDSLHRKPSSGAFKEGNPWP